MKSGTGFGLLQNATLALMYTDGQQYPATFLLTAALVIFALIPAWRERLYHRLQLKAS